MLFHKNIAATLFFISISIPNFGQLWSDLDSGFRCGVYYMSVYNLFADESKSELLVSGLINSQGCEDYYVPARWDGRRWNKLGEAGIYSIFNPIYLYRNEIYSGNMYFGQEKPGFIHLTEHGWDTITGGPQCMTFGEFEEHEGVLYGTGGFSVCNGNPASLVFKYNGESVQSLVNYLNVDAQGLTIEFYHDTLYVGGKFFDDDRGIFHFSSVYDNDIHSVGQGMGIGAVVQAMAVYDDKLWIGGAFAPGAIGNEEDAFLAYYDGHSIKPAPFQTDGRVVAMEVYENELYIGGWFSQFNGMETHGVAKMNQFECFALNPDTVYSTYGSPASRSPNVISDIAILNDTLYMGGTFSRIGNCENLNSIAKLNKSLTGKQQPLQSNFNVYPNPTAGELILETNAYFNQSAPIQVYDASGRLVLEDTWLLGEKQKHLFLNALSNGMYVLQVITKNEVFSRTVIRE